jgi:hypothetical protein
MDLSDIEDKAYKFVMMESAGIAAMQLNIWIGGLLVVTVTSFNLWLWFVKKSAKM